MITERLEENRIYNEDCLDTLERMEDSLLDLTVTSPPYNVSLDYNTYDDNKKHDDYIEWLSEIFSMIYLKTKVGGRCVINIGDGKNGSVPTHSDIIQMMKEIGWIPMTTIIWDKCQTHSRTAWGSYKSPSCPSFPTPFEYILVFCKETRKLQWEGETDLTNNEFVRNSLAIWKFGTEHLQELGHPAAFPVELPKRCIRMFAYKNSLIYDPFMGSGTTAIAAYQYECRFIGSEISEEYCKIAESRIRPLLEQEKLF